MRFHRLLPTSIIALAFCTPNTNNLARAADPPKPSISCFVPAPRVCPEVSARDLCHFGKKESWHDGKMLRTRYNLFCSPGCVTSGTTCWISNFPEPGRANFIGWLDRSKKPNRLYGYDLRAAGHGYVLELEFF